MNISILGAGAWGTAIAISLSDKRDVILWTRNEATFKSISENRESDKLPGCFIPHNISIKRDIKDTVGAVAIILAVPTQSLREVCKQLSYCELQKETLIIIACKGIEKYTLKLPSEVVSEVLPNNPIAIFSGPSFAIEVAKKLPYSMVFACQDNELGKKLIEQENLKLHFSSDVIGVQICAALKNVFAIACGIILGRKLGFNAHAALITKCMNEVKILYSAKVGENNINMDTLLGSACLGDLVMTCTSLNSRNLSFGFEIGSSKAKSDIERILRESKSVIEGASTAQSAFDLAKKLEIKMSICEAIYNLLYENASIEDIISVLISC